MIRLTCSASLPRYLLVLLAASAFERSLPGEPMVYTGIVVTDVRVGDTLLHNASLTITFAGDTNDILAVPVPSTECTGDSFFYLPKGEARVAIGFRGRTRTARLNEGQLFVAIDQCNGGIGFGSFTGPNGLEPAYPLAFTLGTAEYAAITGANSLTGALSVTGSAWSCVGYPPTPVNALPGTATGNCTSPDAYPLKSDIGDIFVYQPYYEFTAVQSTAIASNHSGSTNRGAFLVRPKASAPVRTPAFQTARGPRVVYTLETVADGSIDEHVFYQALVTLRMVSDTESVTSQASPIDSTKPLYENKSGYATVTIDDGGRVITAEFEPGEVYVRYDTGAGVAGFGSKISPTYPVALNCSDSAYPSVNNYTTDCVQGDVWNFNNAGDGTYVFRNGILAQLNSPVTPSPAVPLLPQSLAQSTLLTGTAHTCAGIYTIFYPADPFPYFPGNLGVCAAQDHQGLRTNRGRLILHDLEGGTLSLGNATIAVLGNESGSSGGWDLANSGYLHVEVIRDDD